LNIPTVNIIVRVYRQSNGVPADLRSSRRVVKNYGFRQLQIKKSSGQGGGVYHGMGIGWYVSDGLASALLIAVNSGSPDMDNEEIHRSDREAHNDR
jgi:hypothetical protein